MLFRSGTVQSLRIDSILSLTLKLSREKSANLIKAGYVTLAYDKVLSTSTAVKKGDTFSVKGYGKFILSEINGVTKKDRIHICIKKYI